MKPEAINEVVPYYLKTWRMLCVEERNNDHVCFATQVQTKSFVWATNLVIKCFKDRVITYGTPSIKIENSKGLQTKLEKFNQEATEGLSDYYDNDYHNVVVRKETDISNGFPLTNKYLENYKSKNYTKYKADREGFSYG